MVEDCTSSLELGVNFKGYLRRALGYFYLGRYQDACIDIDLAIEMDSESKDALDLKEKIMKKWMEVDGTVERQPSKNRNKMKIEEVDSLDEQFAAMPGNGAKIIEMPEVTIRDVEDESDSDDD